MTQNGDAGYWGDTGKAIVCRRWGNRRHGEHYNAPAIENAAAARSIWGSGPGSRSGKMPHSCCVDQNYLRQESTPLP
jgi:hypothetical protein